ncbi:Yip1 family protein [Hymenobacter metallicola]|uniref:YIP1 family protein n=1 Tax=Hymenobacter metallicola TaxID=2563114 RepID=A0A4Z0PTI2_9BACT|nr:Yip1 family protein [Hymenobacter metallicola]TGE21080.1 YIP1 family protein [Hymenobacter metallicola]
MSDYQEIREENVLSQIWLKPTRTLAYILHNQPDKYVLPLLVLGGITRAIDRAGLKDMGDKMPTATILLMAVIGGGLFGWVSYFIYAWLLSATGRWLQGSASSANFRTVIAWALVPSVVSLLLVIPETVIFGDDLFKSEPVNDSTFNNVMWLVFGLLQMTLGIWTLVILIKGTALLQNFTIGKSLLNLLLPALVIFVPVLIIALVAKAFS